MLDKQELLFIMDKANDILDLIENQLRNDKDSLTQSDLQGAIDAVLHSTFTKGKVAGLNRAVIILKDQTQVKKV